MPDNSLPSGSQSKRRTDTESAREVANGLRCQNPRCPCQATATNGKGNTHCPAHKDANPSLSIAPADQTAWPLMHCFAGCSFGRLIKALQDRRLLSTTTTFRVGQWEHVRDDSGASKRMWSTRGAKPATVLYRAETLASLQPGELVLVNEGEKATEAATSLGFPAVGSWCGAVTVPELSALRPLKGFVAVLVPDNHHTGKKHMAEIGKQLASLGIETRWLEVPGLPPTGDLADFTGSREELLRLVEEAPPWEPALASAASASSPASGIRTPVIYSAADLQSMQIPMPEAIVEGLLFRGLNLLAGKPKTGKSWMVLNIAIAVATGQKALGTARVGQGDVLYLALEDGPARLKARLESIQHGRDFPDRLALTTDWRRFDDGGIEDIEAWLTEHPDTRLIVIDTLAKIRPRRQHNGNVYDEDYAHLGAVKNLADRHGIAILVTHHLRKSSSDDPLDLISGTLAISGAADVVLILRRARPVPGVDAQLHIRSRDTEDADLALQFRSDSTTWEIVGNWDEESETGHRATIRQALRDGPLVLKALSARTGIEYTTLATTVRRLVDKGDLYKSRRGVYSLTPDLV